MTNRLGLVLYILSLVSLSACTLSSKKEKTEWKVIPSNGFSLSLPTHMKEASDLHDDAVLQYQNSIRELYCIVILEGETSYNNAIKNNGIESEYPLDLDGYSNLIRDSFLENVEEIKNQTEINTIGIKGRHGRYFEADAKMNGVDIYYHYGFVKGDTTYYQVLSWTLLSKKEKVSEDMLNILKSFKEN
jgi:hypothetical protein